LNELRVFISSTFRDLQEERGHLVKKIFPEIRSLCRERGITFTEVDLRWGLTDQDVALGQVVRTCLEEVDKCRPYFIGITGDRYGFVPTHLDIYKDPELLKQYPWIEDAVADGMSITEMEAQYAVLSHSPLPLGEGPGVRGARFYFRDHRESSQETMAESDELRQLEEYQSRIEASGAVVERFRDPASLGEMIFNDLVKIINRDFADVRPPTALEEERSRHEAFSLSRRRAYIPNPSYIKRLNEHAASDAPPLVVYAESGSGKSSLFAFWAEQYRRKKPDAHVIEHYVGIGATATDHYAVIRHVCMEIKERFGREEEIPSDPAKLETALGQWLGYADHEMTRAEGGKGEDDSDRQGTRAASSDSSFNPHPSSFNKAPHARSIVIILDGLNQLQGDALNLRWIPDVISPSIRLILSSTVESTLVELRRRGWSEFGMQALTEPERETIVVRYLAEYRKSLNPEQTRRIAGDYKCGHPLFLKTLLEELRLVGRHEELDSKITSYLGATGTEDLFQRVLERLEDDYSQRTVRDVMVLLNASRGGLDERELSEISGIARLKIAAMMSGLDYHLVRKEGRLTFFHDYLRRAVEKRYVGDEQEKRRAHEQLATYFEQSEVTQRGTRELLYALEMLGDRERLEATLAQLDRFVELYKSERIEVPRLWSAAAPSRVAAAYRSELDRLREANRDPVRDDVLGMIAGLLQLVGAWPQAQGIWVERLELALEQGDQAEEAMARNGLGALLMLQGNYNEAFEEFTRSHDLYAELGNRAGVASALRGLGETHLARGAHHRALEYYHQQQEISRELDDGVGVAMAINSIGIVYNDLGQSDKALECYRQQEMISRQGGDRIGLAGALHNIGSALMDQGKTIEGREMVEEALEINRSIGHRPWMAHNLMSIGLAHGRQGEYEQALESFLQAKVIYRDLGDRRGLANILANIGWAYDAEGKEIQAVEQYAEALEINRSIGNRLAMAENLRNMGVAYGRNGNYDRAFELYRQSMDIGHETGDSRCVARATRSFVIDCLQVGEYEQALEPCRQMEAIARELDDRSLELDATGLMGFAYCGLGEHAPALELLYRVAREHRSIGHNFALVDWLDGIATVLIEAVETGGEEMPEYLPRHVAGADNATWRSKALQEARKNAAECVTISEALPRADTLFGGRLLLERIRAAEGDVRGAAEALHTMLKDASDDTQRASICYLLWKLNDADGDHRTEALRLFRMLYNREQRTHHRRRIEELTSAIFTEERDGAE